MKQLLLFYLIIPLIACEQNQTDHQAVNEPGLLLPKLSVNGSQLWDFRNNETDTLSRDKHVFAFELENYTAYTDSSFLDNYLIRINEIAFIVIQDGKIVETYYPDIKDSIGTVIIDFYSTTLNNFEYHVAMDLKFLQTDSTFKYSGNIVILEDEPI